MAQWFEGFDGQIVLDDDYVWILREDIPADLTHGTVLPTLRAHRGAVIGTEFRPATASDLGTLRIKVSNGRAAPRDRHPSGFDTVRFSLTSNDRFSTVHLLLAATAADAMETVAPDDQLRAALDELDGIATQTELASVLGESPDVMQVVDGVTWNAVGKLWVAAGGTSTVSAGTRLEWIRALRELTRRVPANAGIKTLQTAVGATALRHLDSQRIGALWESVLPRCCPRAWRLHRSMGEMKWCRASLCRHHKLRRRSRRCVHGRECGRHGTPPPAMTGKHAQVPHVPGVQPVLPSSRRTGSVEHEETKHSEIEIPRSAEDESVFISIAMGTV